MSSRDRLKGTLSSRHITAIYRYTGVTTLTNPPTTMWGHIVQCPTCTTGSPRLVSNPEPIALCTTAVPPKSLWPSKASPSQEKTLAMPIFGIFTAGSGRQTQAGAEGQAVHPPAWPAVRRLSPDRPHRLLPPCRGLIQA